MATRKPPSVAAATGPTVTSAPVDLKDYAAQARRIQEETLEQQLADPPGLPLEDWRPDAKVVRMSQLMPRMVMQGVGGRQLAFASPPQKGSIVRLVLSGDLAKPGDAKGSAATNVPPAATGALAPASPATATAVSAAKASKVVAAASSSPVPALALGRSHDGAAGGSASSEAGSSSSTTLASLPRLAALAAEERSEAGRVRKVGGTKLSLGAVAAHFAFPYNAVPEPRTAYIGGEERLYHVKVLPKESAPGLDAAAAAAAAAAEAAEADGSADPGASGRGGSAGSAASKLSASARRAMAAAARIANMSAGARASMKALQKSAAKYESAVTGSSPRWLSARWRDKPIEPPVSPMAGAGSGAGADGGGTRVRFLEAVGSVAAAKRAIFAFATGSAGSASTGTGSTGGSASSPASSSSSAPSSFPVDGGAGDGVSGTGKHAHPGSGGTSASSGSDGANGSGSAGAAGTAGSSVSPTNSPPRGRDGRDRRNRRRSTSPKSTLLDPSSLLVPSAAGVAATRGEYGGILASSTGIAAMLEHLSHTDKGRDENSEDEREEERPAKQQGGAAGNGAFNGSSGSGGGGDADSGGVRMANPAAKRDGGPKSLYIGVKFGASKGGATFALQDRYWTAQKEVFDTPGPLLRVEASDIRTMQADFVAKMPLRRLWRNAPTADELPADALDSQRSLLSTDSPRTVLAPNSPGRPSSARSRGSASSSGVGGRSGGSMRSGSMAARRDVNSSSGGGGMSGPRLRPRSADGTPEPHLVSGLSIAAAARISRQAKLVREAEEAERLVMSDAVGRICANLAMLAYWTVLRPRYQQLASALADLGQDSERALEATAEAGFVRVRDDDAKALYFELAAEGAAGASIGLDMAPDMRPVIAAARVAARTGARSGVASLAASAAGSRMGTAGATATAGGKSGPAGARPRSPSGVGSIAGSTATGRSSPAIGGSGGGDSTPAGPRGPSIIHLPDLQRERLVAAIVSDFAGIDMLLTARPATGNSQTRPVLLLAIRSITEAFLRLHYPYHTLLEAAVAEFVRRYIPRADLTELVTQLGREARQQTGPQTAAAHGKGAALHSAGATAAAASLARALFGSDSDSDDGSSIRSGRGSSLGTDDEAVPAAARARHRRRRGSLVETRAVTELIVTGLLTWVPTFHQLDSLTAALLDASRFGSHVSTLESSLDALKAVEAARGEMRRRALVSRLIRGMAGRIALAEQQLQRHAQLQARHAATQSASAAVSPQGSHTHPPLTEAAARSTNPHASAAPAAAAAAAATAAARSKLGFVELVEDAGAASPSRSPFASASVAGTAAAGAAATGAARSSNTTAAATLTPPASSSASSVALGTGTDLSPVPSRPMSAGSGITSLTRPLSARSAGLRSSRPTSAHTEQTAQPLPPPDAVLSVTASLASASATVSAAPSMFSGSGVGTRPASARTAATAASGLQSRPLSARSRGSLAAAVAADEESAAADDVAADEAGLRKPGLVWRSGTRKQWPQPALQQQGDASQFEAAPPDATAAAALTGAASAAAKLAAALATHPAMLIATAGGYGESVDLAGAIAWASRYYESHDDDDAPAARYDGGASLQRRSSVVQAALAQFTGLLDDEQLLGPSPGGAAAAARTAVATAGPAAWEDPAILARRAGGPIIVPDMPYHSRVRDAFSAVSPVLAAVLSDTAAASVRKLLNAGPITRPAVPEAVLKPVAAAAGVDVPEEDKTGLKRLLRSGGVTAATGKAHPLASGGSVLSAVAQAVAAAAPVPALVQSPLAAFLSQVDLTASTMPVPESLLHPEAAAAAAAAASEGHELAATAANRAGLRTAASLQQTASPPAGLGASVSLAQLPPQRAYKPFSQSGWSRPQASASLIDSYGNSLPVRSGAVSTADSTAAAARTPAKDLLAAAAADGSSAGASQPFRSFLHMTDPGVRAQIAGAAMARIVHRYLQVDKDRLSPAAREALLHIAGLGPKDPVASAPVPRSRLLIPKEEQLVTAFEHARDEGDALDPELWALLRDFVKTNGGMGRTVPRRSPSRSPGSDGGAEDKDSAELLEEERAARLADLHSEVDSFLQQLHRNGAQAPSPFKPDNRSRISFGGERTKTAAELAAAATTALQEMAARAPTGRTSYSYSTGASQLSPVLTNRMRRASVQGGMAADSTAPGSLSALLHAAHASRQGTPSVSGRSTPQARPLTAGGGGSSSLLKAAPSVELTLPPVIPPLRLPHGVDAAAGTTPARLLSDAAGAAAASRAVSAGLDSVRSAGTAIGFLNPSPQRSPLPGVSVSVSAASRPMSRQELNAAADAFLSRPLSRTASGISAGGLLPQSAAVAGGSGDIGGGAAASEERSILHMASGLRAVGSPVAGVGTAAGTTASLPAVAAGMPSSPLRTAASSIDDFNLGLGASLPRHGLGAAGSTALRSPFGASSPALSATSSLPSFAAGATARPRVSDIYALPLSREALGLPPESAALLKLKAKMLAPQGGNASPSSSMRSRTGSDIA